jgi:inorganic pyrophosphatase
MNRYGQILLVSLVFVLFFTVAGCRNDIYPESVIGHSPKLVLKDKYTLIGDKNLYSDYQATDSAGYIYVVIEIPTGTNEKWEVDKDTGYLKWEFKNGKPRIVKYLGYPGNYGMIPRTLLPKERRGDGDPLDVIILGPAVPRGSILKARLIGIMKMVDNSERDYKLIAIMADSPLGNIRSIVEMDDKLNGISQILEIWFSNYKGPGKTQSKGFAGIDEAQMILRTAMEDYERQKQQVSNK